MLINKLWKTMKNCVGVEFYPYIPDPIHKVMWKEKSRFMPMNMCAVDNQESCG